MSFRNLSIRESYRSDTCSDLGMFFVSRILEHSVIYKRAVGFFSSSSLIKISRGLSFLTSKPNSHVSLVVSPYLYKEDVEAIQKGYSNRKEIVERALLRALTEPIDENESERLNYLCHLIENGILDIKVADMRFSSELDKLGMFHEKIGLFIDENGDTVAFTGSMNESDNAFSRNFESIQVFKSWEEPKRVAIISEDFDNLWNNNTNSLEVYDFPKAVKDNLFKFRKHEYHKEIDIWDAKNRKNKERPFYNCKYELYEYQKEAINNWAKQSYRGMFDMGTGTGKTVTALTASVKLLERCLKVQKKLAVIIVCPYTHLVEQWVAEKNNFNIDFIVGYSASKYSNYLSNLYKTIQDFNDGIIEFFYFITTNASFRTDKVQNALKQIKGEVLFIVDEVHNFGAEKLRNTLNERFKYRIGLSATIDRNKDEEGTHALYDYFGNTVIHYGLKEAIESGVLTRYYYFPIITYLNDEECDNYMYYTKKIRDNMYMKDKECKLTKKGEIFALLRARLIATSASKIEKLREIMEPFKNEYNMLVYCGTGKMGTDNGDEERQIDEVCNMLGNDLMLKTARYSSREDISTRVSITERFKTGDDLQVLVAIKCLDEGVNIPCIKKAFILASSTNPREYIQRRGRVLRKYEGKKYSYIYDFITLPISLERTKELSDDYLNGFKSLAKKEVERIKEFCSLSENGYESERIIDSITEKYDLSRFKLVDEFETIDWEEDNDE